MEIETAFLSIAADDFEAEGRWWTDLIGRPPDRFPVSDCKEWDLAPELLFQVRDTPGGRRTAVSLRVADLGPVLDRIRGAGIDAPDPSPVPGFDTLRMSAFEDPEGNPVALLDGA